MHADMVPTCSYSEAGSSVFSINVSFGSPQQCYSVLLPGLLVIIMLNNTHIF